MARGRKTGGREFVKGKSGNPKGRPPKLPPEVVEACKAKTAEAVATLVKWMESDQGAPAIAAAREILDRGWGKPKQAVEHSGKDGGPIETVNRYETMEPAQRKALIDRELERRRVSESGRGAEEVGGSAQSDSVH